VNALVGSWRLVTSEWTSEDGEVITSMGRDAVGFIIYTEDGHMAYQMMAANRQSFATGDMRRATAEEKLAAFDSFAAYCGTYHVQGSTVVHHVAVSLSPNWVGSDQQRTLTLAGDQLELSTAPVLFEGKIRTGRLVFRRAVGRHSD
jgi:hypothetical protein